MLILWLLLSWRWIAVLCRFVYSWHRHSSCQCCYQLRLSETFRDLSSPHWPFGTFWPPRHCDQPHHVRRQVYTSVGCCLFLLYFDLTSLWRCKSAVPYYVIGVDKNIDNGGFGDSPPRHIHARSAITTTVIHAYTTHDTLITISAVPC